MYLLGEEKAAVEVIDAGAPLPRIFPPYLVGPFARRDCPNLDQPGELPNGLGRLTPSLRSEPMAVTQLLLLYHLLNEPN